MADTFNILSIDGGGIRGVFPAKFLACTEEELVRRNNGMKNIYQHFDLIAGTSTGGRACNQIEVLIDVFHAIVAPDQFLFRAREKLRRKYTSYTATIN